MSLHLWSKVSHLGSQDYHVSSGCIFTLVVIYPNNNRDLKQALIGDEFEVKFELEGPPPPPPTHKKKKK